jgi:2-iminobutanoate/2-iminopropanoate deaminase
MHPVDNPLASEPRFMTFPNHSHTVAPYCHAVRAGQLLFVTGQMPVDANGEVPEGIEDQTRVAMDNVRAIIRAAAGEESAVVVSVRIYLTHFGLHYARMNAVYAGLFTPETLPTRTCVGVTELALGCDIEIDAVAVIGGPQP